MLWKIFLPKLNVNQFSGLRHAASLLYIVCGMMNGVVIGVYLVLLQFVGVTNDSTNIGKLGID